MEIALHIIALVSLSLALINLLPILPLDGGHVFWSLVEKVRGRRVSLRTMEQASVVGFMLILVIFAIGFTNDIDRFSNGGFDSLSRRLRHSAGWHVRRRSPRMIRCDSFVRYESRRRGLADGSDDG